MRDETKVAFVWFCLGCIVASFVIGLGVLVLRTAYDHGYRDGQQTTEVNQ